MSGHPSWCSPQHCALDEYGERVHGQEPVCWEESGVRFESRLLFPDVEYPPATYLQLSTRTWCRRGASWTRSYQSPPYERCATN